MKNSLWKASCRNKRLQYYGFKNPVSIRIQGLGEKMTEEKVQPKYKVKAGNVDGTVWENVIEKDGNKITVHNIKFSRSYKDKDGNWQNTDSFNKNDLPKLLLCAQKCFEELTITKQDN